MEQFPLDKLQGWVTPAYIWVIRAQAKAKDIQGAMSTLEQLADDSHRPMGYRTIAEVQAAAGDLSQAMLLLDKMDDDVPALCDFAAALYRAGRPEQAKHVIDRVVAAVASSPDDDNDIKSRHYSMIALAQAHAGKFNDASQTMALAAALLKYGNDHDRALSARDFAQAQAAAFDDDGALATASQITEDYERAIAYCYVAEEFARIGDLTRAKKAASQVEDLDWRDTALCSVAAAQALAGDVPSAMRTFEEIRDSNDKAKALCEIAKVQGMVGDVAGALQSFKGAIAETPAVENSMARARVFSKVTEAQTRIGLLEEAKRLAESVAEPTVRALAHVGIVRGLLAEEE